MSTIQMNLPAISSDATFRQWGAAHKAAFAQMGLVQAADTGQIDWTAVLAPTAASQQRGYEIWRFADALQATKPVFIKVMYGSNNLGATYTRVNFIVGFATDGAGNMTSTNTSNNLICDDQSAAPDPWCLMSGDTNRIGYARYANATSTSKQSGVHIERSKDGNGVDTGDGVAILRHSGMPSGGTPDSPNGAHDMYIPFSGPRPPACFVGFFAMAAPGTTGIFGLDVGVFPIFPFRGKFLAPRLNALSYMNSDITQNVPVTITHYGAARTFMPLGNQANYSYNSYTGSATSNTGQSQSVGLMMRWE